VTLTRSKVAHWLIRARWIAVITVALFVGLRVGTSWQWIGWFHTSGTSMQTLRFGDGAITLTWGPDPFAPDIPGFGQHISGADLDGETSEVYNAVAPRSNLSIPHWLLAALSAAAALGGFALRRCQLDDHLRCQECGYRLPASGRCPECGTCVRIRLSSGKGTLGSSSMGSGRLQGRNDIGPRASTLDNRQR